MRWLFRKIIGMIMRWLIDIIVSMEGTIIREGIIVISIVTIIIMNMIWWGITMGIWWMNVGWIILLGTTMIYREPNGRNRWWCWMIHSIVVNIACSISVGSRLKSILEIIMLIETMYVRFVRLNSPIPKVKGWIIRR